MAFKIGHTAITWRNEDIADAVRCLAELKFAGIEAFDTLIEKMTQSGTADLCKELGLPIVSAYCGLDVLNPLKRDEEFDKIPKDTIFINPED